MIRVKFNKPGRYIGRDQVNVIEVREDTPDEVFEVSQDFIDFNPGLLELVDGEPEPQEKVDPESVKDEAPERERKLRKSRAGKKAEKEAEAAAAAEAEGSDEGEGDGEADPTE